MGKMATLRHMGYRGFYVHTNLLHVCIYYVTSSTVAKLQASLQAKELDYQCWLMVHYLD